MTDTTTDRLGLALRKSTGIDDLDWATPPTPLHGGFWAEMYTVELADPPLGGPAPVRAIARGVGSSLARRFLHTYSHLTGTTIDPERLAWGRTVHALRAMTEVAAWEHQEQIESHRGHPWLALRPVLDAQLVAGV